MKYKHYLDYNATSPIRTSVIEKVASTMAVVGNPSSVHAAGRGARAEVEEARSKIAALVGARPRDIVFTASGTEANNTVIMGSGAASLVVSSIEHDSTLAAVRKSGLPVHMIKTSKTGVVDLISLEQNLKIALRPALVSVMLANNETGVLQPISEIAEIVQKYGARLHTDAIQGAGKVPIDQTSLGADYITLSGHKIGGPQGVAAIVLKPTAPLMPLVVGGGQELGRRSGTENVAGIAGFGVAAIDALVGLADMMRLQQLRDTLERKIIAISGESSVAALSSERLPNTSCLLMPGVKGETQVMHFDLASICVSSGSACSSGKVKVSHVLSAMGYDDTTATSSIRVSLGYQTSNDDIVAFANAWHTIYNRTHNSRG
ncbi:cysteine desulfurase family protein [Kordiimonas pumila]|uniref:Cysteine desulfurase n=1 Tax=Kordiimonas pumila TaxID=2161677 RepID=A0ABV7D1D0_9PROT|nr:cysteine desulfurase family protein [Kordiimonas pumila]